MEDANPRTASGKRGFYSEGMNNNMNKMVRCLEDVVAAFSVHGHPMACVEGTEVLEATLDLADVVMRLTKAYNAYALKSDVGQMTQGGVKTIAKAAGQRIIVQAQLDTNAANRKKNKK